MSPEELQEIRDWSARKMGWEIGIKDYPRPGGSYIYNRGEDVMYLHQWQPDNPSTGQIWMLVERMRKLGFVLYLTNDGKHRTWQADFLFIKTTEAYTKSNDNPALAIIMAAKATEET